MSVQFTIPTTVLQTLAGAVDIFDQSKAIFEIQSDEVSIHISNRSYSGWMDISYPRSGTVDSGSSITVGVDIACFGNVATLATETEANLYATITEEQIILRYESLTYYSNLINSKHVPWITHNRTHTHPATVELPGSALNNVVTLADKLSETVTIGVDDEGAKFYVVAIGDTDAVQLRCDNSTTNQLTIADVETDLLLSYFEPLQDTIPDSAPTTIHLGDDCPVNVVYSLSDGTVTVSCVMPDAMK